MKCIITKISDVGYEETKDMNMYDLEEYAGEYGDLIVSSTNGEELLIMIDDYR